MSVATRDVSGMSIECACNDSAVREECLDRSIALASDSVDIEHIAIDNTAHAFTSALRSQPWRSSSATCRSHLRSLGCVHTPGVNSLHENGGDSVPSLDADDPQWRVAVRGRGKGQ